MTCKGKKARQAAESAAEMALEQGSMLTDTVKSVAPHALHAGQQAYEYVVPRARQAGEKAFEYVAPRARQAAHTAAEAVSPYIKDARERVSPLVSDAASRVQPAVKHAYASVQDRVEHDVYPKLQELWEEANENATVHEASRRGRSAIAALRGDLLLPEPKPARRSRGILARIATVLGIAALVGIAVVVVRTLLGSKDDGWSPAEPVRPGSDDTEAGWGESPFAATTTVDEDVDTRAQESVEEAEEVMISEGGPLTEEPDTGDSSAEVSEPAQRAAEGYGEGSYVGSEPPEGYTIKGNERSMKFHTPDAAGYDRTNADVWFNSEQAALAAGFTRAMR
ncbi:MAG: hypothetical protein WBL05_05375 [Brooklawnia sp.]|uniref:sunset domain-containing protein n=1 Tax=Brooklawnia sp. TaxID=2699740 RepID=UPI003C7591D0